MDAVLVTAQQSYFNLGQDEANRLMVQQGEVTRKLSGYALLFAIPTIVFGLYGTNFDHIPLLGKSWGYAAALGGRCSSVLQPGGGCAAPAGFRHGAQPAEVRTRKESVTRVG